MYLVLRPPWALRVTPRPADSPPVVVVATDAGVPRPKKKRRTRPAATGQQASSGSDGELEEPLPQLTAADRALEWRGDEVSLPPQTIDMAGGGAPRPLD